MHKICQGRVWCHATYFGTFSEFLGPAHSSEPTTVPGHDDLVGVCSIPVEVSI